MFNRKEITLNQYVELAKIIKESYEYLNVKKASTYYAQATSPAVSPPTISQKPKTVDRLIFMNYEAHKRTRKQTGDTLPSAMQAYALSI